MIILEMLSYPFMQRAFIAGGILSILLGLLGIFSTARRMSFFGDGIAHASLAGIAAAVLLGWAPLPVALAWSIAVALIIYRLERSTRLPSDALIGILLTASMALGVVLLSLTRGYQPELLSFLFGNILAVRPTDLLAMAICGGIILVWLWFSFRQLAYISLAEENAEIAGLPVKLQTMALYVALAAAAVLGAKVLGVILVSALLVIPASTSRLFAKSLRAHAILASVLALAATLTGLTLSYIFDLPAGASVVLVAATIFILGVLLKK